MTVIIDSGSGICKAGFGGEKVPRVAFRSYVGRPKYFTPMLGNDFFEQYIGDEATKNSSFLITKYPIEHGIVINWDDEEKIWDYTYKRLGVNSSDYPVLLTEATMNPKENREKMIQLMFETFNVPEFTVCNQCFLSLCSFGRTTGVICEVGDGVTQIMPIYNNQYIPDSAQRLDIGGRDITEYLQIILREQGYYFTTSEEFELIAIIKEKLGYVALDYDAEIKKSNSTYDINASCSLPDGNILTINSQRFRCAELLFNPKLNGFEAKGVHEKIVEAIEKCETDKRKDLFANILISGGSSTFKNFPERIEKEVTCWAPRSMEVSAIAHPESKYNIWLGGSVLSSSPIFKNIFISRQEYEEAGPGIVHRKCF